jgi:hypothetical protein
MNFNFNISRDPVRRTLTSFLMLLLLCLTFNTFSQNVREEEERLLKEAEENIEKYRKGDAVIQFLDPEGKALKNATVQITQEGHDFLFGCIIFDLIRNENTYREESSNNSNVSSTSLSFPFTGQGMKAHKACRGGRPCYPRLNGAS